MNLAAGATVDRYILVAPLGEGGQAQVWEATDPLNPGKRFALKLLWLDAASPADIERARREAHHLARLAHPTLPACHALFEDLHHHLLGLVLDLVDGASLDLVADDPRLTPELIRLLLRHLAAGLGYLHQEGLVHRDIKPSNVLLAPSFWLHPEDPRGVRIIDLGISVPRGNPRPLTVVGRLIGTPPFMPPEQIDPVFWRFTDDTPAADVFALGVVAWWLLHRGHPTGLSLGEPLSSFAQAYRAVAQQQTPWPPAVSPSWIDFFRQSLALSQDHRAPTAAALEPLLGATTPGPPAPPATGNATPPATGTSARPVPSVTGDAAPFQTGDAAPFQSAEAPLRTMASRAPDLPQTGDALFAATGDATPHQTAAPRLPVTQDDLIPGVSALASPGTNASPSVTPNLVPVPPPVPLVGAPVLVNQPPATPPGPAVLAGSSTTPARSLRRGVLVGLGVLLGALLTLGALALLRPGLRRRPRRLRP